MAGSSAYHATLGGSEKLEDARTAVRSGKAEVCLEGRYMGEDELAELVQELQTNSTVKTLRLSRAPKLPPPLPGLLPRSPQLTRRARAAQATGSRTRPGRPWPTLSGRTRRSRG